MVCVRGCPCSSTTGWPEPPTRKRGQTWSATFADQTLKPSNTALILPPGIDPARERSIGPRFPRNRFRTPARESNLVLDAGSGRPVWTGTLLPAAASNICSTRASMADVATSIGFRPTPDDERILREAARPGESTTETLRRALRLLDHDRWLEQFRADAEALKDENLNAEPEAW